MNKKAQFHISCIDPETLKLAREKAEERKTTIAKLLRGFLDVLAKREWKFNHENNPSLPEGFHDPALPVGYNEIQPEEVTPVSAGIISPGEIVPPDQKTNPAKLRLFKKRPTH